MGGRGPNESTGLLEPCQVLPEQEGSSSSLRYPPPRSVAPGPSAWRTIIAVAAVQVTLNVGSFVSLAAQLAVLEDVVCEEYYRNRSSNEADNRCKIDAVQSEVAFINGWKDVFEVLPAIVLAVPYGALADRIGRKRVLLLAIVGIAMNDLWTRIVFWFHDIFPVRTVLLGGLWQIIGAGAATLSSISHVMVADMCPSDQRTTAFSQLQSATMIAQFLFVPIGGALLSIDPWIPLMISSAVTVLGFLGALVSLHETLPPSRKLSASDLQREERAEEASVYERYVVHRCQRLRTSLLYAVSRIRKDARLVLVILCFFPATIGQQAGGSILLQYASKRLNWSFGTASYLLSLGAAINLVVHAIGIPALSTFLLWRMNLHEIVKDKRIAQVSGLFLVMGTGTCFAARSWVVLVLGQVLTSLGLAFTVPVRSIVTSMVAQEHLAALYTAISVVSYSGLLVGGPLLAKTFQSGLQIGGLWLGMPFLVACICFMLALLAVSSAPGSKAGMHAEYAVVQPPCGYLSYLYRPQRPAEPEHNQVS